MELQQQIATGSGYKADYELCAWQYEDAIRRGDRDAAHGARSGFWRHAEPREDPSGLRWGASFLVRYEQDAGDLAAAAEDILRWLELTRVDDMDGCKQAVRVAVEFLETPGGSSQPMAPQILERARTLGISAEDFLSYDTLVGLQRLLGV